MPEPDPRSSPRVEEIFQDYLRRRDGGEVADFAALCRAHPGCAEELRMLLAASELLDQLLPGSLDLGGDDLPADPVPPSELLQQLRAAGVRGARYLVRGELGRGGMGVVYRVWDGELRRSLAMKIVQDDGRAEGQTGEEDSRKVARFIDEAQITSQLDHPGIVPVHEIGLGADGRVYFTMRLVPGDDLRTVFERVRAGTGGWNQVRALGVILKVCEAMSYAHAKRVIHRDLKPANVMVGKFGEVYVMDWGLARMLSRPDPHDLRLRPDATASQSAVRTERDDHRDSSPDSPLITMDGQVVGTPAYMPPEQAKGQVDRVGPHSDVYSVGAMLYELISGQMPFVPPGVRVSRHTLLMRVIEGPPRPLSEFGRTAPAELVAICEKAMEREPADRYPDMQALAEDLQSYVEGRVVRAHATGTWAETRKWVRRNRALAGALAASVAILVAGTAMVVQWRSASARASAVELTTQLNEFRRQCSDWESTAIPSSVGTTWWIERASDLISTLPEQQRRLAALSAPARMSEEVLAATSAAYHETGELKVKRAERRWRRRMLGKEPFPSDDDARAELDTMLLPATPVERNALAFGMVRPDWERILGGEVRGRVLAERVVTETFGTNAWHPRFRDTLAFAWYRVGRFDKALAEQRLVIEDPELDRVETPAKAAEWRKDFATNFEILKAEEASWQSGAEKFVHDSLDAQVRAMEGEIGERALRRSMGGDSVWHEEWSRLVADLIALESRLVLAERALPGGTAGGRWVTAIAAIRDNPKYRGLDLTPQLDLVPIHEDKDSGLWEFAHLPSGEPVQPGPDGKLLLTRATGLVFVLLPEGQVPVEGGRLPDPVNDVRLAPFFLSKYEMTELQWSRLGGRWTGPMWTEHGLRAVHSVNWNDCQLTLRKAGGWLRLPTEAQWEYGCRAGTATPWWTGTLPECLAGAAFVDDVRDADRTRTVGRRRANPFGLHDVHGNVSEWCLDAGECDVSPRPGDGLRDQPGAFRRMTRGGSSTEPPEAARSLRLNLRGSPSTWTDQRTGLRPARPVTR